MRYFCWSEEASAGPTLSQARSLYAKGDYENAAASIRASLSDGTTQSPTEDVPLLHQLLGQALLRLGDVDGALEAFADADNASKGPDLAIRLDIAEVHRIYRDPDTGEEALQEILEIYQRAPESFGPRDTLAAGQAAQALAERTSKLYREALSIFERAAEKNREDPRALTAIGDLLLDRYNNAEARSAYNQALALDANFVPALFGLARSLHFDHSPAAEKQIEKVLAVNPNHLPALAFGARLQLDLEQYEKAEETYRSRPQGQSKFTSSDGFTRRSALSP